uniref:Uncharacterized protein n=1 Tax=Cannabis sativa TaxID=3483 RepID=A0A803Q9D1_CANSA
MLEGPRMNNGRSLPNPVDEDGAYDPTKYIPIVELENHHLRRRLEEANQCNVELEQIGEYLENEMPSDRPGTREPEIPRRNKGNLGTQPGVHGSSLRDHQRSFQTYEKGACTNLIKENAMNHTQEGRARREEASVTTRHTITHSRSTQGGENTRRNNDQDGKIRFMSGTRKVVSIEEIDVDSGRYNEYGWEKECFDMTIQSLKGKIDFGLRKVMQKEEDGGYYRLLGLSLALQFWFFECCPYVIGTLTLYSNIGIPRFLNWPKIQKPKSSHAAHTQTGTQFDNALRISENDDDEESILKEENEAEEEDEKGDDIVDDDYGDSSDDDVDDAGDCLG